MVIKITEEMYDAAVVATMRKFAETNKEKMGDDELVVNMMMGFQNALFASMLRTELFDIKEDK